MSVAPIIKRHLFKSIVWLLPLLAPVTLLASNQCEAISSGTKDRLERYVHDKFDVPPATPVELVSAEPIGDSCERKAFFRRTDTSEQIMMFLSSDQRFLSREVFDSTVDLSEQRRNETRRIAAELTKGDLPSKGKTSAPVTIVVFSDFECPFCKRQAEILKREFTESEVRIVFRNLPLPMHPWARIAAESARCVYEQSSVAFWDLHDSLFQNQEQLITNNIQQFVQTFLRKRTDVQGPIYEGCLSTHSATAQIEKDVNFATENNIHATPTLFINGVRAEGVRTASQIRAYVLPPGPKRK